jgi:hypothetical protein
MIMREGSVYCIRDAPHQHGDLWVEVTLDLKVRVLDPAGAWWRGREFTLQEFREIFQ